MTVIIQHNHNCGQTPTHHSYDSYNKKLVVLEYNNKQADGYTKAREHMKPHMRRFLVQWATLPPVPNPDVSTRLFIQ